MDEVGEKIPGASLGPVRRQPWPGLGGPQSRGGGLPGADQVCDEGPADAMPTLAAMQQDPLAAIQAYEDELTGQPTGLLVGLLLGLYADPEETRRRLAGESSRLASVEVQHRVDSGLAGEFVPVLRDVIPAAGEDPRIDPGQSDLQAGEYTAVGRADTMADTGHASGYARTRAATARTPF